MKSSNSILPFCMVVFLMTASPALAQTPAPQPGPGDAVVAWGANLWWFADYGQTDAPIAAQSKVTAVAAGLSHSLAMRIDGTVVAWGKSLDGTTYSTVLLPPDLKAVIAIAARGFHSLALVGRLVPRTTKEPMARAAQDGQNLHFAVRSRT